MSNMIIRLLILITIILLSSCSNNSPLEIDEDEYLLEGVVFSDYDQRVITYTEILLNNQVADTTDGNGYFRIEGLETGTYKFQVNEVMDHRTFVDETLSIPSTDLFLTIRMPFKYNLIDAILSSEYVWGGSNLLETYPYNAGPSTIMNDSSVISLRFDNYFFSSDTIEIAYHFIEKPEFEESEVLFDFGMKVTIGDTISERMIQMSYFNDWFTRVIKFNPISLGEDSTKVMALRIIPNTKFKLHELNIEYLTIY